MMNTSDVFRSEPIVSLRPAASEILWRGAEVRTPISQQYNTAGAALVWPKAEASTPIQPQHNATGTTLLWTKKDDSMPMEMQYVEAKVITLWSEHWIPSEPHQELMPWVGWFRTVSARNALWEYTWPEEEWLHP
jgi:hypothetical protein